MRRPAKHLYGLSRVSRSPVRRPNLNLLSSHRIKRPAAVQKLCAVHPPAIHSSRRRLPAHSLRNVRLQFFADVRLGRKRQIILMLFVHWLWLRVKTSRDDSEPIARVPAVASNAVWPLAMCPIKSAESCRAQRRPAVLRHQ